MLTPQQIAFQAKQAAASAAHKADMAKFARNATAQAQAKK